MRKSTLRTIGHKEDDQKDPQQPPQDPKKKKDKELEDLIEDLKLRIALLENTTSFYKDAMFSARFTGNGQAKFDRDRNDKVIENMFFAQQAITAKDFPRANKLIDDALEQDEYLAQAWLLKGSLRYLQNDFQGAKSAWERCLKIDPYDKVAQSWDESRNSVSRAGQAGGLRSADGSARLLDPKILSILPTI